MGLAPPSIVVALVLLTGCATVSGGRGRATRVEEASFRLALPAGWERGPMERHGSGTWFNYRSADGSFLAVVVDPEGMGSRADSWWKVEARGHGVVIVDEEQPCRPEDDPPDIAYPCPAGDGVLSLSAGDVVLNGRTFLFFFGSSKREAGVDLQPFRDILLSLRAR